MFKMKLYIALIGLFLCIIQSSYVMAQGSSSSLITPFITSFDTTQSTALPETTPSSAPTTVLPETTPSTAPTTASLGTTPSKATTTASPEKSTAQIPITTPQPTTLKFKVENDDGKVCLAGNMMIKFTIPYVNDKDEKMQALVPFPAQYNYNGSCAAETSQIIFTFYGDYTFYLGFTNTLAASNRPNIKATSKSTYSITNITLTYNTANTIQQHFFIDPKDPGLKVISSGESRYPTKDGEYYSCKSDNKVTIGDVTTDLSNFQVRAFMDGAPTDDPFDGATPNTCDADKKPVNNTVPIVVGCVLGGLVVAFVVGFLIFRRRRRVGYQAV